MKSLLTTAIALLVATISYADEAHQGELLNLEYSDFVQGHRDKNKHVQVLEFIPDGENISSWSELLSLYIINKQGAGNKPTNVVQSWLSSTSDTCSDLSVSSIEKSRENGYETSQFSYKCSASNIKSLPPEWGIGKHIVGNDSDYFILKAWRTAPTKEQRKTWINNLSVSSVCDTRTNEHTCE